jgi:hypothetical protein
VEAGEQLDLLGLVAAGHQDRVLLDQHCVHPARRFRRGLNGGACDRTIDLKNE